MYSLVSICRPPEKEENEPPTDQPASPAPSRPSLLRMVSIKLRYALNLRHSERLIHALDKMPWSPAPPQNPTLFKHLIDGTVLLGHSAKEDPFTIVDIAIYNLSQHLRAGAINRSNAVDVEDDIFVVFRCPNARQGRVGRVGAVELESAEAVLKIARVGEGERFRHLDDEAAFEEFEGLGVVFRVFKLVLGAGDFAEDLDARFGGVADDGEEGEADTEGNAEGQGVEDCGGEDQEHEGQFRPTADVDEEFDVVGGFFHEGIGNDGYHG